MSDVKSYFDKHAHQHVYHNDPEIYKFILDFLNTKILEGKTMNILDVGCGDGSFIQSILKSKINAQFIGTDVSQSMIKLANQNIRSSNVQLFVADGFSLPLNQDAKFDLIHLDSVLHHLIASTRNKSKHLSNRLLRILIDKLKEDGSLIVEEVYYNSYLYDQTSSILVFYGLKFFNALHLNPDRIIKEFHRGLEVRFFSEKEISRLLATYGTPILIKKIPWRIPALYKLFLVKETGHISLKVNPGLSSTD
ncbi:MAG TPA: class I SAM-dependent methyltransferase [Candidatus Saccharimonadales bacterium]|nr:class I SAM-dependent methyltransferase [Candidatus Saccharimonadales bacterium]